MVRGRHGGVEQKKEEVLIAGNTRHVRWSAGKKGSSGRNTRTRSKHKFTRPKVGTRTRT